MKLLSQTEWKNFKDFNSLKTSLESNYFCQCHQTIQLERAGVSNSCANTGIYLRTTQHKTTNPKLGHFGRLVVALSGVRCITSVSNAADHPGVLPGIFVFLFLESVPQ